VLLRRRSFSTVCRPSAAAGQAALLDDFKAL
jgi:hypothetical protein